MTFWESQNCGDSIKISGFHVLVRKEGSTGGARRNFRAVKTILYDTIMVEACQYTFVQTHRMNNIKH